MSTALQASQAKKVQQKKVSELQKQRSEIYILILLEKPGLDTISI